MEQWQSVIRHVTNILGVTSFPSIPFLVTSIAWTENCFTYTRQPLSPQSQQSLQTNVLMGIPGDAEVVILSKDFFVVHSEIKQNLLKCLLCVYMCMFVCLCVSVCVCICMHPYMWKPEDNFRSPWNMHIDFLRQGLSLAHSSPIRLKWPKYLPASTCSELGLLPHTSMPFLLLSWIWGSNSSPQQVLCQVVYLPKPRPPFV